MTGLTVSPSPDLKSNLLINSETSAETLQMEYSWLKSFIISTLKLSKCTIIHLETPTKSNSPIGIPSKVTLKQIKDKVLNKLGLYLTEDDCSRLANATPTAIEALLY